MQDSVRARMSIEDFEQLVIEAIDSLPEEFIERLDNVDITVESAPTQVQLAQQGIPDRQNYGFVLPDKITIFQESIEMACDTSEEIVHVVRDTVVHEVAHHFGIDDDALHALGL